MFSVLMSVYALEKSEAFEAALQSLASQTVLPSEVVVVKDGPLSESLEEVLEHHRSSLNLVIVPLPRNLGLARALNEGLKRASQPWIMRFDSDDICLPHRVQRQMEMAGSDQYDVFGAQIREFDHHPGDSTRARLVPLTHQAIKETCLLRNPFNHMTVCYRRGLALALGGYPNVPLMEDYAFWSTMLSRNVRTANAPEALVLARIGNGMVNRRGGLRYCRSEWALQAHMVNVGLKPRPHAILHGLIRSAVFLSPAGLRAQIYGRLLRQHAGESLPDDSSNLPIET